jgi:hypothetical protein
LEPLMRRILRVALFTIVGLIACAVFAPVAHAQALPTHFVVPSANATAAGNFKTERPFADGIGRYQQIYKAADILKSTGPVRLNGVRFRAASTGQSGGQIDVAVTVGLLSKTPSNQFDQNLVNAVPVFPRSQVLLVNSFAGAWVLSFPFQQEVVWDGTSDLVVDIRVYGNFNNNQRFFYDFDGVIGGGPVEMLAATTPNAASSQLRYPGRGLVTRFDIKPGITFGYGNGCKGDGGVIPQITTNTIPVAGDPNFTFLLSQARPGAPALLLWGLSNTQWAGFQLPLDLTALGVWGCDLNVAPDFAWGTATNGVGAGNGVGQITWPIPPVATLVGVPFWAQWAVIDQSTSRPLPLTMSPGLALVIG